MVREVLPTDMKKAKVEYTHKLGKTDWASPESYRAISLLSTRKMAEKAIADYLSFTGETQGWWHPGQCDSRSGKSITDALAYLQGAVRTNTGNADIQPSS
jgi:phytoene dehydrogenase-like protein